MKPFREIFARFRRETAPSPRSIERLRERVGHEVSDAQVSRAVLQHLPGVAPGAEARVRARLAAPRPAPSRRPVVVVGLVGLAAAAAGLALVALQDDPQAPVQASLSSDTQRAELSPSPELALVYQGVGSLDGTRQAPHIRWESGTVHLDVEPEQGIELVVDTPEAQVQVVGTAFAVTRDALGTRVEVDRGRVRVTCLDGDSHMLGAEERVTCLPTNAQRMLVRINELRARGASPEQLLASAEHALERYPGTVLDSELQVARIEALHRLDRFSEAYRQAQAYLEAGHEARRDDLLVLTARLAFDQGGCAEAVPWFLRLAAEQPTVSTLVKLADCLAATEPEAARAALEQAQALEPDARWAAAIEQRLGQL
jgi:ferric-dicitrate binding protein FerR (iron transport regulator)